MGDVVKIFSKPKQPKQDKSLIDAQKRQQADAEERNRELDVERRAASNAVKGRRTGRALLQYGDGGSSGGASLG